jgi:UDP-GlcNAc:undecaprenyl-phosphate GlcNAc-1-phosphate transferase
LYLVWVTQEIDSLALNTVSSLDWMAFAIVFTLAFATTFITVPFASWLGRRLGITARVGGRRRSEADRRRVSKMGGLAIYAGFTVAIITAQLLPVPRFDPNESIRLTGLVIGSTFIFVMGLLDDLFDFSAVIQGIGQIIAAGIAVAFLIFIEGFNNPLTGQPTDPWPFVVTVTFSMLWLGVMMNTVNFLDGLDGLAGGVAFIAGVTLFVNSALILRPPQTSVSLLPLALMGSSLAFVLFNFYPSRIIMGGGATYLGYILGALSIIGGAKMATILLVMGLPLMDLAWQAANRLRQGRNPMHGDRGHLHFRLLDMGFSQRSIVLAYYSFCAFFGILTLVLTSQFYKFIAFAVMIMLLTAGFLMITRVAQTESSMSS